MLIKKQKNKIKNKCLDFFLFSWESWKGFWNRFTRKEIWFNNCGAYTECVHIDYNISMTYGLENDTKNDISKP